MEPTDLEQEQRGPKDVPMPDEPVEGSNFAGWGVCKTDGCKLTYQADPNDNAVWLVKCEPREICEAPCKCRLFSWHRGWRWWDSHSDQRDHGRANPPRRVSRADYDARHYRCLCVTRLP